MHANRTPWHLFLLGLTTLALVAVWGCDNGDDDDSSDDDDTTSAVAEIKETEPQEGATDFYHRNNIIIEFTDEVTGAQIVLNADGGGEIAGANSLNENSTELTFDPTDALEPSTSYTATISWDDHADVDLHFQTSSVGTPVGDESAVVGNDYFLDLSTAKFTQPPGVGNLLAQYLTDVFVIMHIKGIDGSTIDVYGGIVEKDGNDYIQDLCTPTLGMTENEPGLWDDPYMQIGPTDFEVAIEGYEATIAGLMISGSFTSDGSMLVGGTFDGQMDTRVLDELIDPNAEEGAACELLGSLGISCEECPDGSGAFCLTVSAYDIVSEQVAITAMHVDHPDSGETYDYLYEVSETMIDDWEAEGFCDPPEE